MDDKAQALLTQEMRNSFGQVVWPDMSRGNLMSLKVSEDSTSPSPDERLSYKKMATYRSIDFLTSH
jgi:hypothetical protein